jgi:hypothetical protein
MIERTTAEFNPASLCCTEAALVSYEMYSALRAHAQSQTRSPTIALRKFEPVQRSSAGWQLYARSTDRMFRLQSVGHVHWRRSKVLSPVTNFRWNDWWKQTHKVVNFPGGTSTLDETPPLSLA